MASDVPPDLADYLPDCARLPRLRIDAKRSRISNGRATTTLHARAACRGLEFDPTSSAGATADLQLRRTAATVQRAGSERGSLLAVIGDGASSVVLRDAAEVVHYASRPSGITPLTPCTSRSRRPCLPHHLSML